MNCYNMVLEYINTCEKGIPIFIEEIKEYIMQFYNENDKEKVFNNIKAILNRMNKDNIIETAYKGIYYIPKENVFGKMLLGNRQIIQYKYIMDKNGNIKGYITGAKLFNDAHLTTQVPNIIDIATNECKNFNKYENKNLNVIIRKTKLGWERKMSFEQGLLATIRWYLNNADWIEHIKSGAYKDWIEANYGDRK